MSAEIKLQAGQWYRRRDGEIVYCFAKNPVNVTYPYHLCCEDGTFETVDEAGDFCDETDDDDEDIIEHLPDCTGFDWEPTPKLQLREGAWYERKDGKIVGPCVKHNDKDRPWAIDVYLYSDEGINSATTLSHIVREVDPPQPPQPKYRPFKDRAEFKPFRDKWVKYKQSDVGKTMLCVSFSNEGVTAGVSFMPYKTAFDSLVFEDGSPFGVLDDAS